VPETVFVERMGSWQRQEGPPTRCGTGRYRWCLVSKREREDHSQWATVVSIASQMGLARERYARAYDGPRSTQVDVVD